MKLLGQVLVWTLLTGVAWAQYPPDFTLSQANPAATRFCSGEVRTFRLLKSLIVVEKSAQLQALNDGGQSLWSIPLDPTKKYQWEAQEHRLALIEIGSKSNLRFLELETGRELWRQNVPGCDFLALDGDQVYLCSGTTLRTYRDAKICQQWQLTARKEPKMAWHVSRASYQKKEKRLHYLLSGGRNSSLLGSFDLSAQKRVEQAPEHEVSLDYQWSSDGTVVGITSTVPPGDGSTRVGLIGQTPWYSVYFPQPLVGLASSDQHAIFYLNDHFEVIDRLQKRVLRIPGPLPTATAVAQGRLWFATAEGLQFWDLTTL